VHERLIHHDARDPFLQASRTPVFKGRKPPEDLGKCVHEHILGSLPFADVPESDAENAALVPLKEQFLGIPPAFPAQIYEVFFQHLGAINYDLNAKVQQRVACP
jgi:hypothetical protein